MKFKYPEEEMQVREQLDNPVFCKVVDMPRRHAHSLALRNRLYVACAESGMLIKVPSVGSSKSGVYSYALNKGQIYILTNDLH